MELEDLNFLSNYQQSLQGQKVLKGAKRGRPISASVNQKFQKINYNTV
jgi:hypothetical protein